MANPTLLEMPIARDGAKNSIPSTTSPTTGLLSQQFGWQDINSMPVQQGGKAPSRLDFNGVLNLLSNILFYCQKGWQFEWDSSQAYYAGCIVKDTSDGKMYMCLNDVTSTTAPHSDTTNWKVWDLSLLANYLPLAGGAMTGTTITRSVNDSALVLSAGTDSASIQMNGKSRSINPGRISLQAYDGTNYGLLTIDVVGSLMLSKNGVSPMDLGGSAIVAKSITPNGYKKTADGLIMQWGVESLDTFTQGEAGSTKLVTFPITFPSGNIRVFANFRTVNYEGTYCAWGGNATSSGFNLSCNQITTGNVDWLAIGY